MFMIKPLIVKDGLPIISAAHHVSKQAGGFYIAYSAMDKKTRRPSVVATIYHDSSGNFLVQAEQNVLDTIPGGETLQAMIERDPSSWHAWKCDTVDNSGVTKEKDKIVVTDKIKLDVTKDKPIALDSETRVIGAVPTIPGSIATLDASAVENECKWIGDKAEKVEIKDVIHI